MRGMPGLLRSMWGLAMGMVWTMVVQARAPIGVC